MPAHRGRQQSKRSIPTTRVSVIVLEGQSLLLVKHRKLTREYWVLPGGRLEYGETFFECAVREVREETGLEVSPEKILFLSEAIAPDRSKHIVNIYVGASVVGGRLELGEEDVLAGVDFIPLAQLESLTLYPPVSSAIIQGVSAYFPEIKYLGNLWV